MISKSVLEAYRALSVINLDPRIRAFLLRNDPQALEQVNRAILALEVDNDDLWPVGKPRTSNSRVILRVPEFEIFDSYDEGGRPWATIDLRQWFPDFDGNVDISGYLNSIGICGPKVQTDPEYSQSYFYFDTRQDGEHFKTRLQKHIREDR